MSNLSDFSWLLICLERPEQVAHSRSFVLSEGSERIAHSRSFDLSEMSE